MAHVLPLLVLGLALQQAPADAPDTAPDPQRVKEVLVGLELGFKGDEPGLLVAALREARGVADPAVASAVARALKEKAPEVRFAAVETLRFLHVPEALKELELFATRERKTLKDDPLYFATLLRACAQHAKESTIDLLIDDVWASSDQRVMRARLLGLANIRCDRSLEELFALTNQAGKFKLQPYMDDIRLALLVLTGETAGATMDPWWDWWNKNRKTFHVAPEMPLLPPEAHVRWNNFWKEGDLKPTGPGR